MRVLTPDPPNLDLQTYLTLLRPGGTMTFVGIVPKPMEITALQLIYSESRFEGWCAVHLLGQTVVL